MAGTSEVVVKVTEIDEVKQRLEEMAAAVETEREAAKIARDKAIQNYAEVRRLRERLRRVVAWANSRLSLDGFDPQDTPFVMSTNHEVAWNALKRGDLDPVEVVSPSPDVVPVVLNLPVSVWDWLNESSDGDIAEDIATWLQQMQEQDAEPEQR